MSLADALAKKGFASAPVSKPELFLSTGNPILDNRISGKYLGGGIPIGRMVEIFGPPSAGKTLLAQNLMKEAQKAGGFAMFMDHEHSFDSSLAVKLGLSEDPNQWLYRKPETFEESIDEIDGIVEIIRSGDFGIDPKAPICVVLDSLAAMVPKSKWDKSAADYNMHDNTALARATSAAFPAFSAKMEKHNVCVVILNQMRTKPGVMFGSPETSPGGDAPKFYSSVRLKLGGAMIRDKKTGTVLGKHIGCETVKNKIFRPHLKAEWDFLFQADGSGQMDVHGAVIEELKTLGVLETAGAYIVWTDGKRYYKGPLCEKIANEGLQDELFGLLPK